MPGPYFFRQLWLGLLLCLGLVTISARANQDTAIAVIVAAGTPAPRLNREQLALIFKLKKRFLEDGQAIHAVNLPVSHPLRRAFSLQLLGRVPEDFDAYWSDMYFHGVLPPYVLASEEAMIRFVATTPGAIGYVSHCMVDQRVSIVLRVESTIACPR